MPPSLKRIFANGGFGRDSQTPFPATAATAGLGKVVSRSSPKRWWLSKGFFGHRRIGGCFPTTSPVTAKTAVEVQIHFRSSPGWQGLPKRFSGFWGSLGGSRRSQRWSWGSPQRPRRSAETENGRTEGFQGLLGLIAGLAGLRELNFRHPPKWWALSMLLPK